jgi:hypothetical protein
MEVGKRPIWIKTELKIGKGIRSKTLDKKSEIHIIIIRQSILADLVPLTDQ